MESSPFTHLQALIYKWLRRWLMASCAAVVLASFTILPYADYFLDGQLSDEDVPDAFFPRNSTLCALLFTIRQQEIASDVRCFALALELCILHHAIGLFAALKERLLGACVFLLLSLPPFTFTTYRLVINPTGSATWVWLLFVGLALEIGAIESFALVLWKKQKIAKKRAQYEVLENAPLHAENP